LPYYISTPIIFKLLEYKNNIKDIYIMLQREVATRVTALPGQKDYSPLSIAVQLYCAVEESLRIPAKAFWPRPKVESTLLRITPLPKPRVAILDEALFSQLVRASFAHRRKTLRNSLRVSRTLPVEPSLLEESFRVVGIDPRRRAETLSIEEWAAWSNYLSTSTKGVRS
jgi:16S rRNA (adenine1518-N6/adenine1519-N6)-dimethyltransferase